MYNQGSVETPPRTLADQNRLIQMIAQLPSLQRRDLVRQLFLADDTLQQTLRAEIAAQAERRETEQDQQSAATLTQLRHELTKARRHNTRCQHTIEQLEDQLLAARVSCARLADDLQALTHRKHILEREKQTAVRALAALRKRATTRASVAPLSTSAQASPVCQAVLEVLEVSDTQLLPAGLLLLQPRTTEQASRALDNALRRITTLVEQCRKEMATAQAVPSAPSTEELSDEHEA